MCVTIMLSVALSAHIMARARDNRCASDETYGQAHIHADSNTLHDSSEGRVTMTTTPNE